MMYDKLKKDEYTRLTLLTTGKHLSDYLLGMAEDAEVQVNNSET